MFLIPQKILIYKLPSGRMPFSAWFNSLDSCLADIVSERLEKLERGYFGDFKNLGEGVYELRIHFSCGYRIYFSRDKTKIILLLCGGEKNSQKRDIKKAKIFWEDYKNAQK